MPLSSSAAADLIYNTLTDPSLLGNKSRMKFESTGTCTFTTIAKIAARIMDVKLTSDSGHNMMKRCRNETCDKSVDLPEVCRIINDLKIASPLSDDDILSLVLLFQKPSPAPPEPVPRQPAPLETSAALAIADHRPRHRSRPAREAFITHFVRDDYQQLDTDNLITILHQRDGQLRQMVEGRNDYLNRYYRAQKSKQDLISRSKDIAVQFAEFKASINYRGTKKRKVTPQAGYTMAMKRARTYASGRSAIALIASDACHGALRDPGIIERYEHKLCLAYHLASRERYLTIDNLLTPTDRRDPDREHDTDHAQAQPDSDPHHAHHDDIASDHDHHAAPDRQCSLQPSKYTLEHVHFRGDATNQSAINKNKVHTGETSTLAMGPALHQLQLHDLGDRVSSDNVFTGAVCDIQSVTHGTTSELIGIVKNELRSVGRASWTDRVTTAGAYPNRVSQYNFTFDSGPDNIGWPPRLRSELAGCLTVMCNFVWCQFHQFQLIIAGMCRIMDDCMRYFQFPETTTTTPTPTSTTAATSTTTATTTDHDLPLPCSYFSCLKIISNTWRSSGSPDKIFKSAAALYTEDIASDHFKQMITRALAGRWASGNQVEHFIDRRRLWLGSVFNHAFRSKAPPRKRTDPNHDPDLMLQADDFAAILGRWRMIAVTVTNSTLFYALVKCSTTAAEPIIHALYWGQSVDKATRTHRKAAMRNHSIDVTTHEPFLAAMASHKAEKIRDEITDLFNEKPWEPTMAITPTHHRTGMRHLALAMIAYELCEWDRRIVNTLNKLPLSLLTLLHEPPHCTSERRSAFARDFLLTPECCLVKQTSDVPWKLRRLYYDDFAVMAAHGTCPTPLWLYLCAFRTQQFGDTQEIEGRNNVLQNIVAKRPRMRLATANTRLFVKENEGLATTEQCASSHIEIVSLQNSDYDTARFSVTPEHVNILQDAINMSTPLPIHDLPTGYRPDLPVLTLDGSIPVPTAPTPLVSDLVLHSAHAVSDHVTDAPPPPTPPTAVKLKLKPGPSNPPHCCEHLLTDTLRHAMAITPAITQRLKQSRGPTYAIILSRDETEATTALEVPDHVAAFFVGSTHRSSAFTITGTLSTIKDDADTDATTTVTTARMYLDPGIPTKVVTDLIVAVIAPQLALGLTPPQTTMTVCPMVWDCFEYGIVDLTKAEHQTFSKPPRKPKLVTPTTTIGPTDAEMHDIHKKSDEHRDDDDHDDIAACLAEIMGEDIHSDSEIDATPSHDDICDTGDRGPLDEAEAHEPDVADDDYIVDVDVAETASRTLAFDARNPFPAPINTCCESIQHVLDNIQLRCEDLHWEAMLAEHLASECSCTERIKKGIALVKQTHVDPTTGAPYQVTKFVLWENPSEMTGWVVRLRHGTKLIVFIVPRMETRCDFSDSTIIIGNIPVFMHKSTPHPMPRFALLTKRSHDTRHHAGPFIPEEHDTYFQPACVLCDSASKAGLSTNESTKADDHYTCSVCLQNWHRECLRWTALVTGQNEPVLDAPLVCPACHSSSASRDLDELELDVTTNGSRCPHPLCMPHARNATCTGTVRLYVASE